MGSTNFLQWNPGQNNQESDAAWAADSQRVGGATNDEAFPSPTANKLFYQASTGVTALMQMMATKGFVVNDTNIATLASVLSALLTTADIRGQVNLAYASTVNLNVNSFLGFELSLNGNLILTVTGGQHGDVITLIFVQDATGGRTVAFPGTFFGGVQPDPEVNGQSVQQFVMSAGGLWLAVTPNLSVAGVNSTPIGVQAPAVGVFTSLTATGSAIVPTETAGDNSAHAVNTAWAKLGLSVSIADPGYVKLPTWLGGLVIQWGLTSTLPNDTPQSISFPTAFPAACFGIVGTDNTTSSGNNRTISCVPSGLSGFTILSNGSGAAAFWVAWGK